MFGIKQKISNWFNNLIKEPPPCPHTNLVTIKRTHYNMIVELERFIPEHWPENSSEQI